MFHQISGKQSNDFLEQNLQLLLRDPDFPWGEVCETALRESKNLLISAGW
jgi:hypothetical protein